LSLYTSTVSLRVRSHNNNRYPFAMITSRTWGPVVACLVLVTALCGTPAAAVADRSGKRHHRNLDPRRTTPATTAPATTGPNVPTTGAATSLSNVSKEPMSNGTPVQTYKLARGKAYMFSAGVATDCDGWSKCPTWDSSGQVQSVQSRVNLEFLVIRRSS